MSGFDDLSADDWTTGQFDTPAPADPMDFVIPSFASGTDVAELEREQEQKDREWAENRFRDPEPGNYLFEVAAFPKGVERKHKTGYVNGQFVEYDPFALMVRFAVVGDPKCTLTMYMELPPGDPEGNRIYQEVMGKADGKVGGWFCRQFEQFVSKLGYPVAAGQPYPAEALAIKNWIGKQVYATVEKGREDKTRVNAATGMPYPARSQFKTFSFRQAESTMAGDPGGVHAAPPVGGGGQRANGQQASPQRAAHPGQSAPGQRPAAPRVPGPGHPGVTGAQHARNFAQAGLNNV